MGAQAMSSRSIVGRLIKRIEETTVASWVGSVSWLNDQANQEIETYKWLGVAANMREWIGPRAAKGLQDYGVAIESKEYEDTLEIKRRELYLDKTAQVNARIDELAAGAARHWAQLLSPLIANGADSVAQYGASATYDGVDFFGNGHRGSQDNEITDAAPAAPASPTTAEFTDSIMLGLETLMGFTDEQGEPANEGMSSLLVMVPTKFYGVALGATRNLTVQTAAGGPVDNTLRAVTADGIMIDVATNVRLDATFGANNKFAIFRTDHTFAPFIRQEEEGVVVDAIAEGSEEEIKNNRHLYGVRATRGVGYGLWEHAVEITLT